MEIKRSLMLILVGVLPAALSAAATAQETAKPNPLITRGGWEIGAQVAKYHYEEPAFSNPDFPGMNLDGPRLGAVGAYTFTSPNRVYTRIDLRVSYGLLEYESGDGVTQDDIPDWLGEARVVVGRDYLVGGNTALSPYIGLGYRYLYNDLRGYTTVGGVTYVGYRRYSRYVYVPLGLTVRFRTGERWVLAPTVEYDAFLGGQQRTKVSDFAPGAPDVTNDQENGRGYRAYLMLENGRWAFGPWAHYWKIKRSDVVSGGFEPENTTREYGVELRYRF